MDTFRKTETPATQAGEQNATPVETVTRSTESDGQTPGAQAEAETTTPNPAPPLDLESSKIEAKITKSIRQLALEYLRRGKWVKEALGKKNESKDKLAYNFALKKAILLGNGGRDSEWGPFVTGLRFHVRTVDRWIEKKLDSGELPAHVAKRLTANKKGKSETDTEQDANQPDAAPNTTVKTVVQFSGKPLPDGVEILECIFPFTADEKAEFLESLSLVGAEKAKRLFMEVVKQAAETMRGQQADPAVAQQELEAAQAAASDPTEQARASAKEAA